MKILLTIYAAINLIAFILFGVDKRRAIRHSWRISEACLLLSAAMFGGLECFSGNAAFPSQDKTSKICNSCAYIYDFSIGDSVLSVQKIMPLRRSRPPLSYRDSDWF